MAYNIPPIVLDGDVINGTWLTTYIRDNMIALKAEIEAAAVLSYPVGTIFTSTLSTNPATLLGFGTWAAFGQGRVLIGAGTSDAAYTAGAIGGESTHTLSAAEMPVHTHAQNAHNHTQDAHVHGYNSWANMKEGSGSQIPVHQNGQPAQNTNSATATNQAATATNQNAGSGAAHNNMPPYVVVYLWLRTA